MSLIRRILAATDLSELSLPAVDRGFQLALATGADYTIVHALGLDALGPLSGLLGARATEVSARAIEHQRQALAAVAADDARNHGIVANLRVEPDQAAEAIPAIAAASDTDLVVVGARGASALRRLLIGSTASRLLRKSRCPVLVVKAPCRGVYRRVLAPVDFSPSSELSLRVAREIAPGAQFVLLNVFDVPFEGMLHYAGVSEDEIHRMRAEARERALRDLHALAARAGLTLDDYVPVVKHGDAVRHILDQRAQSRSDLIVMGKHGIHVTEELLLGSVTKRVLSETRSDMLVVVDKHGPGAE